MIQVIVHELNFSSSCSLTEQILCLFPIHWSECGVWSCCFYEVQKKYTHNGSETFGAHVGGEPSVLLPCRSTTGISLSGFWLEIKDSLEDEIDESGPKIFRIAQFHESLVDKPFLRPYFWGGTPLKMSRTLDWWSWCELPRRNFWPPRKTQKKYGCMAALLPAGALAFSATVLPRLIAPPVPVLVRWEGSGKGWRRAAYDTTPLWSQNKGVDGSKGAGRQADRQTG